MIKNCLLIMLGGGIGAVMRYALTTILNNCFGMKHWATFCVNVTGCFALGFLFEILMNYGAAVHIFIITGIIGSYTTFSAFEYENIDLIAHEKYFEFLKYATMSCFFAFLAVALGFYLGTFLA